MQFSVLRLRHDEWADRQGIHARPLEAINRFLWSTDDGLIFIEAGIQNYWNSSPQVEGFDQVVVKLVLLARDRLQSPCIVHVVDGTELFSFLRTNLVHMQHEGRRMIMFKIFVLVLRQYRGRKRTKPLTVLDAC